MDRVVLYLIMLFDIACDDYRRLRAWDGLRSLPFTFRNPVGRSICMKSTYSHDEGS
jgi:hypothetical protein